MGEKFGHLNAAKAEQLLVGVSLQTICQLMELSWSTPPQPAAPISC